VLESEQGGFKRSDVAESPGVRSVAIQEPAHFARFCSVFWARQPSLEVALSRRRHVGTVICSVGFAVLLGIVTVWAQERPVVSGQSKVERLVTVDLAEVGLPGTSGDPTSDDRPRNQH